MDSLKAIIGEELLLDIQNSYMEYLGSSAAIYEINGDYAASLFSSNWCGFLNQSSKKLCGDVSSEWALKSGKWICHEDCWRISLKAMREGKPSEEECSGGIIIYAAPIIANEMVIGVNNAGVSNPPTDKDKIREIALRYKVDKKELLKCSAQYARRPDYVFKASRNHILTAGRTISGIFLQKNTEQELDHIKSNLEELVEKRTLELEAAATALTESERRFKQFFEKNPELCYMTSPDGKILDINRSALNTLGYKKEELIGHELKQICASIPRMKELFTKWKNRGSLHNEELEIITKNGEIRMVLLSSDTLRDDLGCVLNSITIQRDITERKKIEDELIKTKNFLSAIIEENPFSIWISDEKGRLIDINKSCCDLINIKKEEVIGKYNIFDDNIVKEQGFMPLVKRVFERGEAVRFELIYDTFQLKGLPLEKTSNTVLDVRIFPIFDSYGRVTNAVIQYNDISESKFREQEIVKSNTRFKKLFKMLNFPLGLVSKDGVMIALNDRFVELFGYTLKDVPTLKEWWELAYPDLEYRQWVLSTWGAAVERAMKENTDIESIEYNVTCKNGKVRAIIISGAVLDDSILTSFFDITERKRMEKELKRLNEDLKERVKRETELRVQQEQMLIQQSKMAVMGEMIGAIAHQWKQPLNAVSIIAQDFGDAFKFGELNERYVSISVKNIMDQVYHMSRTIDDFRNFFKLSKERLPFNVNTAIKETLSLIYRQLEKSDISIIMNCLYEGVHKKSSEPDMPNICFCEPEIEVGGYSGEFKHVILILINNARDAILKKRADGLFKDGEKGEIAIEIALENKNALIIITDNGGGIPFDIKDKIFDSNFTTKQDGMGIGLYLSKTIIEQNMDGRLYVENIKSGSRFVIELPLTQGK